MRLLLCLWFLFTFAQAFCQIKIDKERLYLSLSGTPESNAKTDSSYYNYYISEGQDTMWFQSSSSVLRCETTASVSPYHNKCSYFFIGERASGNVEIVHQRDLEERKIYKGTLKNGFFYNGKFEIVKGQCLIYEGEFSENMKTGFWITRSDSGNIIKIEEYDSRLEFPIREWTYDESGKLLEFIDELILLKTLEEK